MIDIPGVRTLRPDVDAQTLEQLFADIVDLADSCRFRDCAQNDEPGYAVREAIDPLRLRNFHKNYRAKVGETPCRHLIVSANSQSGRVLKVKALTE